MLGYPNTQLFDRETKSPNVSTNTSGKLAGLQAQLVLLPHNSENRKNSVVLTSEVFRVTKTKIWVQDRCCNPEESCAKHPSDPEKVRT